MEIESEGGLVQLRAAKHRALLAVLLLHANQVVSYGRLLDELWGEEPPATAIKTLQVYVAALRKALVSRPDAAALPVAPHERAIAGA